MVKGFKSVREIEKEFEEVAGGYLKGELRFRLNCHFFMCKQLAEINKKLVKKKRKPSEFNLFVAKKTKGGKMSLQEAVKLWAETAGEKK